MRYCTMSLCRFCRAMDGAHTTYFCAHFLLGRAVVGCCSKLQRLLIQLLCPLSLSLAQHNGLAASFPFSHFFGSLRSPSAFLVNSVTFFFIMQIVGKMSRYQEKKFTAYISHRLNLTPKHWCPH